MAKTDRQTDTNAKATWWAVTAYNDDINIMENKDGYPDWVLKVYGGREVCPTTGTLHFQGAVQCVRQQRFTALKKWLPTANLKPARDKDDLKKYVMKEETAVGPKNEVVNDHALPYMTTDMILFDITKWLMLTHGTNIQEYATEEYWWKAVNDLLMRHPKLAGNFLNKQLMNLWLKTIPAWKHNVATKEGLPV